MTNKYFYYQNEFKIQDKNIVFDLHLKDINEEVLEKVNNAVINFNEILEISQRLILEDYDNKGEVEYYISEWNEYIFPQLLTNEEFKDFISDTNPEEAIEKRLLSKLKIVRIAIYAYTESDFITLDYAFGKDNEGFQDDMLVVCLNSKFDLMSISNEG